MSRLIDISRKVSPEWKPHKSAGYSPERKIDFPVILKPDMPDARGRTTRGFAGGLHTGTHIDAPQHLFETKAFVNDIPLDTYMGEALLVDMYDKVPKGAIDDVDLEKAVGDKVKKGDILLVRTGWSNNYGKPNFQSDSPYLTCEAGEWCIRKGLKMVGADCHPTKPGEAATGFKPTLLGAGIPFLSDLDNLEEIKSERVTLIAFPLNFVGVEASMVRAVALEEDGK